MKYVEEQNSFIVLDLNGNIIRHDAGANMIYVNTGSDLELFHDRIVYDGKMTPAGFGNGLLSILNGMKLPQGTFDASKLYNGKISIALPKNNITTNEGILKQRLNAYTSIRLDDGSYKLTYQHINGASLTVYSIQTVLGIHEYYVHGVLGKPDERGRPEIVDIINNAVKGYPYK